MDVPSSVSANQPALQAQGGGVLQGLKDARPEAERTPKPGLRGDSGRTGLANEYGK